MGSPRASRAIAFASYPRRDIMTRRSYVAGREGTERMAEDKEPELFADPRQAPPREVTRLSPLVRRLIAPNASPFTFNGTCTYILGRDAVAILDPGPGDEDHLAAILAAVEGETIETILVTHTHRDHSVLSGRLKQATGAASSARRRSNRSRTRPAGSTRRTISPTRPTRFCPTASASRGEGSPSKPSRRRATAPTISACLAGRGGAVLRRPCHGLVDLGRRAAGRRHARLYGLARQAAARGERIYWPGHGGPVVEPQRYVRALAHHRRQREASILAALDGGVTTIPEIVAKVYAGLDPKLVRAAGLRPRPISRTSASAAWCRSSSRRTKCGIGGSNRLRMDCGRGCPPSIPPPAKIFYEWRHVDNSFKKPKSASVRSHPRPDPRDVDRHHPCARPALSADERFSAVDLRGDYGLPVSPSPGKRPDENKIGRGSPVTH